MIISFLSHGSPQNLLVLFHKFPNIGCSGKLLHDTVVLKIHHQRGGLENVELLRQLRMLLGIDHVVIHTL